MKRTIVFLLTFFLILAVSRSYSYTPTSYELMAKVLKKFNFDEPVLIEQNVLQNSKYPAGEQDEKKKEEEEEEKETTEEEGMEEKENEDEESEANENKEEEEPKTLFSTISAVIRYPISINIKLTSSFVSANYNEESEEVETVTTESTMDYVINDDDIVEVVDNRIASLNRNLILYFYELFAFDNIDDLISYLETIHIDPAKVTLGLYNHRIHYVLGSDYIRDNNNQLWIDKETYLPTLLKVNLETTEGALNAKFEFSNYYLEDGIYFPNIVKYFKNDEFSLEFVTTRIENTKIDDEDLFNVKKIIKEYSAKSNHQNNDPEEPQSE